MLESKERDGCLEHLNKRRDRIKSLSLIVKSSLVDAIFLIAVV